jgi:hypothetical protein
MGSENFEMPAGQGGQGAAATEAAAAQVVRHKYAHPLDYYGPEFQRLLSMGEPPVRTRAIKRWIAIGREAVPPEVPPLDEPWRLASWWIRRMAQRAPEWITAMTKLRPADEPSVAPPPPAPLSDAAEGPLFAHAAAAPVAAALPAAAGFRGALDRCRAAEMAAGELYASLLRQAAEPTRTVDDRQRLTAEAEQARRSWDEQVDRLRTMERDAEKILTAGGRMWNADEVVASQDVIHLAIREGVRGLLRRVRPKLLGLSPAEQDAIYSAEVERLFAAWRTNKFTAPPPEA